MKLKNIFLICLLFATTYSFAQTSGEKVTQNLNGTTGTVLDSGYSYKTIQGDGKTWGYDIYKGDKRIIHQQNMPGISGNEGFKSQPDAEKVAELVITKLKKGEMPPSVTKEELKNLKVL